MIWRTWGGKRNICGWILFMWIIFFMNCEVCINAWTEFWPWHPFLSSCWFSSQNHFYGQMNWSQAGVYMCVCVCLQILLCSAGLEVRAVCVCSLQRPNSSAHAQKQQPPIHTEPSFCQTPGFHYSKEDEHWHYAQTEAGLTSKFVAFQITHAFSQEVRTEDYFMQLIVFMLQRYSSRG